MKKTLLGIVTLALCVGCSQKETSHKQTLHLNLATDPASLNPRQVRILRDLTVAKQLYEGLTRLDAQGIPQPALAESIDVSEDLCTYTFHLKKTFWSDGTPLTAHDLVTSWREVLSPAFACDYAYMLYPIKRAQAAREQGGRLEEIGVRALDDKTFVVELHTSTPYFLELTAFPTYFPVAKEGVYNGPFQVKKWTFQQELLLEKNPHYWDASSVSLQAISFAIVEDPYTVSQLFEKEELDWMGHPTSSSISTETIEKMKEMGRLNSHPMAGTYWFNFNVQKAPFDLPKLRQAFSYATNRQAIITHILQGEQTVATGPVPPYMSQLKKEHYRDANTPVAEQLFEAVLRENGWTRATFPKVVVTYTPSERNTKIVQLVQQQWEKTFGIPISLEASEYQLFTKRLQEGLYQVGTGQWVADYNDPLAFLERFKYANETGWEDESYKNLLNSSLVETDPEKRILLLQEAEKVLMEAMPLVPVYHFSFEYVKNPNLKDEICSPLGIVDFKYANLN